MEISSPGVDPYAVIGFDKLRAQNTYDEDGVIATIGDTIKPSAPAPSITTDLANLTAASVAVSAAAVTIAGITYEAGQALTFTLTAASGLATDGTPTDAELLVDITSVNGYRIRAEMPVRVYDYLAMR